MRRSLPDLPDEPSPVRRYVVVLVDGREFGLPVEGTMEVLPMVASAPLPGAPSWVAGAIDVHGTVLPLVDLRARLGVPVVRPGLRTPIVLVGRTEPMAGLICDAVTDVVAAAESSMHPWDGPRSTAAMLWGIVQAEGRLIPVLDPEELIEATIAFVHDGVPRHSGEAHPAP